MINEYGNEVNLSFEYGTEKLNAVFHSWFDLSNQYVTIIVPGIFGDRGDSRAMFTRLARSLCMNGFSVLRFDFLGGGSNWGNYYENDFNLFIDQLNAVTNQLLGTFSFLKKVIYVGFSEGLKFAFYAASKREDVVAILSCNGLCVEEANIDKINRPIIKYGNLIYDSNYGTWLNWRIAEKYKEYFIDSCLISENIDLLGVYCSNDVFSERSRKFWEKKNWPLEVIQQGDHLYTKTMWVQELIDILVKWHCSKIGVFFVEEREFFLRSGKNRICLKLFEKENRDNYILFLHGLFQNKSGPGFLFTQMADRLRKHYNICMFDFPASGDSEGNSEELTYELMQETLLFVINFLKQRNRNIKIYGIASGFSNFLLYENIKLFNNAVLLFPNDSHIWDNLRNSEKLEKIIDTNTLYNKYIWAEDECCVLGNLYNRSKGVNLATDFLKKISNFSVEKILNNYDGYAVVNRKEYGLGNNCFYIEDRQGLAMSAKIRDKLIECVINIIEKITL